MSAPFRVGDVVRHEMTGADEHRLASVGDRFGTVVGTNGDVLLCLLTLLRRPLQVGDLLTRPGREGCSFPTTDTDARVPYLVARNGWTHADGTPIDVLADPRSIPTEPAPAPVVSPCAVLGHQFALDADVCVLCRSTGKAIRATEPAPASMEAAESRDRVKTPSFVEEHPKNADVLMEEPDPARSLAIRRAADPIYQAARRDIAAAVLGSCAGIFPSDVELTPLVTTWLDAGIHASAPPPWAASPITLDSLRETMRGFEPVKFTVAGLARALFATDPGVIAWVDERSEAGYWRSREERQHLVTATVDKAWTRREPTGARERAETRAADVLAALRGSR